MIVLADKYVLDNVTVEFDGDAMVIHTKGLPNHPTGKFPEMGGSWRNPNYIQEHDRTYFIPLNPKVNPRHIFTARDNSNHALPMGPIGIAVNGIYQLHIRPGRKPRQGFETACGQYASWSRHLTESTGLARERLRSIDYLLARYRSPISPHTFALLWPWSSMVQAAR